MSLCRSCLKFHPEDYPCASYAREREAIDLRLSKSPEALPRKAVTADGHPKGCLCKVCVAFTRGLAEAHRTPFTKKTFEQVHVEGCQCRPCVAVKNRMEKRAAGVAAAPLRGGDPAVRAKDPTVSPKGSAPPLSNTGETEIRSVRVVLDGGKLKEVMVRLPSAGEVCFIDTVSFTVYETTWFKTAGVTLVSDDEIITEASQVLHEIFGFGISAQRAHGMNFYQQSWVLGDDFGNVCFGGQQNTMQVVLNGQGCLNARSGWESRLQTFLENVAVRPRITRIDLAHDDFEGEYSSPEFFDACFDIGGFNCGFGEDPEIQHLGNWKRPKGKGRTIAIGKRTSGKYFRGYEKGCEQGDPNSKWFRSEIEFKSSDRVIPLDILTAPSGYFIGAYPCFGIFSDKQIPQRIAIKKKSAEISISHAKKTAKHQLGKLLYMLRDLEGDDTALLDELQDTSDIPKRFKKLGASLATCPESLHQVERKKFDLDAHLQSPATFAHRRESVH